MQLFLTHPSTNALGTMDREAILNASTRGYV